MNDLMLLEEFKSDLPRPDHIPPVSTVTKRARRQRALQLASTVAVVAVLAIAVPAAATMRGGRETHSVANSAQVNALVMAVQNREPARFVHVETVTTLTGLQIPDMGPQRWSADLDLARGLERTTSGGIESVSTRDASYLKVHGVAGWVKLAVNQPGNTASVVADPRLLLRPLSQKAADSVADGGVIDGVPTWLVDLDGESPSTLGIAAWRTGVLSTYGSMGSFSTTPTPTPAPASRLLFRAWVGSDGLVRKLETSFRSGDLKVESTTLLSRWNVPVVITVPAHALPASDFPRLMDELARRQAAAWKGTHPPTAP